MDGKFNVVSCLKQRSKLWLMSLQSGKSFRTYIQFIDVEQQEALVTTFELDGTSELDVLNGARF